MPGEQPQRFASLRRKLEHLGVQTIVQDVPNGS